MSMMEIMQGYRPEEMQSKYGWQGLQGFPPTAASRGQSYSMQPNAIPMPQFDPLYAYYGMSQVGSGPFGSGYTPFNNTGIGGLGAMGGSPGIGFGGMGDIGGEGFSGVGIAGTGLVGPTVASPNSIAAMYGGLSSLAMGDVMGAGLSIGKGAIGMEPGTVAALIYEAIHGVPVSHAQSVFSLGQEIGPGAFGVDIGIPEAAMSGVVFADTMGYGGLGAMGGAGVPGGSGDLGGGPFGGY